MSDEKLTIQSLDRWARKQAHGGKGVDAYTLRQAAITLQRVTSERDRMRGALQWYNKTVHAVTQCDHEGVCAVNALMEDGGFIARSALQEDSDEK
jgi:hypothetical protein